ncbi:H-2 class II histocompatibility antigen, I-A beta chain Precursor [Channa argus]|uniref:H-2 class II histocompatibility antigen, I-A beta chain n=1 Tax=Channa argus TaxID=215402 RepID=A0A6G1PNX5_CHAAH|nr:H-2 class II histocompatibility antigen, I-A beta chain Precursor [Channa argus]
MHPRCFLLLLCLFLFFSRTGAVFGYGLIRCQLTSTNDVAYLAQIYFNKVLLAQYNSTAGNFSSYTESTKEIVDNLNKNPTFLKQERKNEETCRTDIQLALGLFLKPVEPYVSLKSVEAASSTHPAMLICSVYNFYPKQIKVTWLRDGKEVTSDVTSTEELSNGNWLYQIHSYLEYTPRFGEKITCMVEHVSFQDPKLYDWDPIPASEKNKIAAGTAGLLLGLAFLIVGIICYKKNTPGRSLVPTS